MTRTTTESTRAPGHALQAPGLGRQHQEVTRRTTGFHPVTPIHKEDVMTRKMNTQETALISFDHFTRRCAMLTLTLIQRRCFPVIALAIVTLIGCGADRSSVLGPDVESASKAAGAETQSDDAEREALGRQYPGLKGYDLDNLLDTDEDDGASGSKKAVARTGRPAGIGSDPESVEMTREELARLYPGLQDYDLDNLLDADSEDE